MIVYISCFKTKLVCPGRVMRFLSSWLSAPSWFVTAVTKVFPVCQSTGAGREVKVKLIEDDVRFFNETLAQVIVPMLIRLKASEEMSVPEGIEQETWVDMLDDMIYGFSAYSTSAEEDVDKERVSRGLGLFATHYEGLKASGNATRQQA